MKNKIWFIDRDKSRQIVYVRIDEILSITKRKNGSLMSDFIDSKNRNEFDKTIAEIEQLDYDEIASILVSRISIEVIMKNGDNYFILLKR